MSRGINITDIEEVKKFPTTAATNGTLLTK
jgi:hypothetical protein